MLALTIVVITILFILSYLIFDKDLLAPPTAVALVFLFGCMCALYNEKSWGLEFSIKSTGLIAVGIIATIVGGIIGVFLVSFFKRGVPSFSFSHKVTKAEEIVVGPLKTGIVIVFQLVAFTLLSQHIRQVTGISNVFVAVSAYRHLSTSAEAVDNLTLRMPFVMRNILEFSGMISIVYAYIVGNNLVASKKKMSLNWLPLVIRTLSVFIQGDRSNMIRLWVIVLIVAYTIHRRTVGWRSSRETRKVIRRIAISVVLMGAFFVVIREFTANSSTLDPLHYVTFYAGSPIAVLDQLWHEPITEPIVFGQRILFYFNNSTTALFGFPGRYLFWYNMMRSPAGVYIGNAPTVFRPAYVEFGLAGMILFLTIMGAFFTILYCKCREKTGNSPIELRLLIYAFVAYVFMMYFYSTFFDFLSHLMLKYIAEWLLIRWFLVGVNFKKHYSVKFGKDEARCIKGNENTQS